MSLLIVLIRLALSVVFGVAGVTKILDQEGTREAVINFGSPKSVAPTIAVALPLLELSIADTYTPWQWQNYVPGDRQAPPTAPPRP